MTDLSDDPDPAAPNDGAGPCGPSPAQRPWWPHLRAAMVLFHFVAVCVLSIPASGAMRDISAWRAPHAHRELGVWTERARSVGFDVTQPEFERWLWGVSTGYLDARAEVVTPFALYAQYTGAVQGWSMFANPQTDPCWLTIDVRGYDGEYRTIYRERSATEDWMRSQLDHNRLRKLEGRFGRGAYDLHYRSLVEWLAKRAALDFADASHLRARIERKRTPDPFDDAETDYLDARWEREMIVDLEALR